jgi:hypothetical protein
MSDAILCPSCGTAIPLTEAIEHQIDAALQARLKSELKRRDDEHAEAMRAREAELRTGFDVEHERRERESAERAQANVATELADLRSQVTEKDESLKELRERELEFLREKRQLEDQRANLQLEVERRVTAEREQIAAQAVQRLNDEHRLKLAEKDQRIGQMAKQIDDLQDSSEQMRAGLIGEVLERDIEDVLRERFPSDRIEPVRAGAKGADVLQIVAMSRGHECGAIFWESKRTKTWDNRWIAKLKEDQAERKADVAVLVSTTLPVGVDRIEFRDGIWIVDHSCVVAVATALRETLLRLEHMRAIEINRNHGQDRLFEYMSGQEFRQWIVTGVETVVEMQRDFDDEKRAVARLWKKREKQIERMAFTQAGMYGDLQGIMGGALAPVESLELPQANVRPAELPPAA